ncbi:MAG: Ni/Co efflux regulator RcnB, partial [Sphingomonas echinoides]
MEDMMRKFIATALLAATLVPVAASAQSNEELRRDRQDIRRDQRDLRDARHEYREDVRDRERAWGRDDWRGWRDRNPNWYARGRWEAPFRYTAFRPGLRIGAPYYGPRYIIADPWRYHLRRPAYGQQWIRHYDDVILVDTRRG